MAKLAVFAIAFTAFIALSGTVCARKTITTTTVLGINRYDRPYIDSLHDVDNGVVIDGRFIDGLDNKVDWPYIDSLRNGKPFLDGVDNGVVIDGRIWDDIYNSQQCRSQIPIEQLNHCKMHLTQGIIFDKMAVRPFSHSQEQHLLQQCCSELKQVREQCQCAVIQQAFNKAWQAVEGGLQKVAQIASKAYELPHYCGLKVQDCPLKVPRV